MKRLTVNIAISHGGCYRIADNYAAIFAVDVSNVTVDGIPITSTNYGFKKQDDLTFSRIEIKHPVDPSKFGLMQINKKNGLIETFLGNDRFFEEIVVQLELQGEWG